MAEEPVVRDVHIGTGVRLRYLEQGDPAGRAILLLHPWGESLSCFDRLIPSRVDESARRRLKSRFVLGCSTIPS